MRPCGVDEHWEVPEANEPAERTFIPGGPLGQKATTVRQLADAARQIDPPQTEETLP